ACFRMAERNHDAGIGKYRDHVSAHHRRGHRHQHDAAIKPTEIADIIGSDRANEFLRMRAAAPWIDERSLEMDAENSWNAFPARGGYRLGRSPHDFRRVGHDGREEAGGAKSAMSGGDPSHGLKRGTV